jgi:hypothetical protein
MHTIHLQGIGRVKGKPAGELKVGDILSWNNSPAGYEVVEIRNISDKSIEITERNRDTGEEFKRRLLKSRIVASD